MNSRSIRQVVVIFAGSVLATCLWSQSPAAPKLEFPQTSPVASVRQRVGLTDINVVYWRPSLRGRRSFGPDGIEPYGSVWRTGANAATKITFSTPVKFGGRDVPAGTYALYSIPGESEWTLILNSAPGWGSYGYDAGKDVARATARPVRLTDPVETFAIGFSKVRRNAVALDLVWDRARVSVEIEVDVVGALVPRIAEVMASDAKDKPYFDAAMFYYENDLDLKQAAAWMESAVAAQPGQMWMLYRQGLILAKLGDREGAIAAARKSIEAANTAPRTPPSLRDEYVRLNEALIASLR